MVRENGKVGEKIFFSGSASQTTSLLNFKCCNVRISVSLHNIVHILNDVYVNLSVK